MVLFQHAADLSDWELIENDEAFVFTLAAYNQDEIDQNKCEVIDHYYEHIRGTLEEYCDGSRVCENIMGYQIDVLIGDPELNLEDYLSQAYLFSNDPANSFTDNFSFDSLPDGLYRLTLAQWSIQGNDVVTNRICSQFRVRPLDDYSCIEN